MIYLSEREIGFDAVEIGFPAGLGCRAIVLVTSGGLFGYHLNGNLNLTKKTALVNFITQHPQGNARKALVYWGSLPAAGSVHAHFQDIHHNTCTITSRAWSDPADNIPAYKAAYVAGPNRAIANGAANAQMFINVSTAGLKAVYPTTI